jgi:hypothetical protein
VHPHPLTASTLILALIIITFCYTLACMARPFGACRKCGGYGRHRSPSGRAGGYCHRCHGTGARLRTGRRIFNYLLALYREGRR